MKRSTFSVILLALAASLATTTAPRELRAEPKTSAPKTAATETPSPAKKAEAQALLNAAYEAYQKGEIASARAKIEAALKLAPRSAGAHFALGLCFESLGLLREAVDAYERAAALAEETHNSARQSEATAKIAALKPKIQTKATDSRRATDDASPPRGAGATLTPETSPSAPSARSDAKAGEKPYVNPGASSDTGADASAGVTPDATPAAQGAPATKGRPLRTAGIAIGLVGVASVGAGIATGVVALGKKGASDAHCDGDRCDPTGYGLRTSGRTFGNASTAAFIGGAALMLGGTTLFIIDGAGGQNERAVGVTVSPFGAAIHGSF